MHLLEVLPPFKQDSEAPLISSTITAMLPILERGSEDHQQFIKPSNQDQLTTINHLYKITQVFNRLSSNLQLSIRPLLFKTPFSLYLPRHQTQLKLHPAYPPNLSQINPPRLNPLRFNPPKLNPPKLNPPKLNLPRLNLLRLNPPKVNRPSLNPHRHNRQRMSTKRKINLRLQPQTRLNPLRIVL